MSKITRSAMNTQMEHAAIVAHGAHPEYRLEIDAPVALVGGTAVPNIYQGSIVSLNTNKEFVLGVTAGTAGINYSVPMVSMKNVFDPDVVTGIEGGSWRNTTLSAVGGKITAIPVTGGYEFETTEFASGTYSVGDALVGKTGKVEVLGGTQTVYASEDPVIGFVTSTPVENKGFHASVLGFLACYFPEKR